MRSQREMYEYQIALEQDELAEYPQEEAAELALIYEARGLEAGQAKELAASMIADPVKGLDALAREELRAALEECFAEPGPYLLNVKVTPFENVYPMVPAGGAINEMVLGPVNPVTV